MTNHSKSRSFVSTGFPRLALFLCFSIILFLSPAVYGQNVTATLKGTVVDPQNAAIPGAHLTLTNVANSATFHTTSNSAGDFVFPVLPAGQYKLTVDAVGFQQFVLSDITLTASEIRSLENVKLSLGKETQSVQVTETAPPIQLASGERSDTVTGTQLKDLALKGRDFFALMDLVPGVVDTAAASRLTTSAGSVAGIYINGNRSEMKNFSVDGIGDMDTGSFGSVEYEPNMDSIAEVKVLTSNFDAEYGRHSGGLISVITKGGGQQFHGSGWEEFRNTALNANTFFNNSQGVPKPPYRYNIFGYSIGGPVYIPNHFNSDRSKLFFFASQEYTRQSLSFASTLVNMPTAAERTGDFSQALSSSGSLIKVKNPQTGAQFPGNIIPSTSFNALGQAILNFFPLPNYVDPNPANDNLWNYLSLPIGNYPRRNDMVRIDASPTQKLRGYFRWDRDYDNETADVNASFLGKFNWAYTTWSKAQPGKGYVASITYTINPKMVMDFGFGKGWNSSHLDPINPSALARTVIGNSTIGYLPQLFPNVLKTNMQAELDDSLMMPSLGFGTTPVNPPTVSASGSQFGNHNDIWQPYDNFSWVVGNHQLKMGIWAEDVDKVQIQGQGWDGGFSFAVNSLNPYDSGDSFSNALLGNFYTYGEGTGDSYFDGKYWGVELYAQDNWHVTRRLTLDYGVRFYYMQPQYDVRYSLAGFFPQDYSAAQAPLLYAPGLNSSSQRVGVNPATGATVGQGLIGLFVPGTGNPANGMEIAGENGVPGGLFTAPALEPAPRFGFAYDPFGKGRTVIRGGIGLFYDRDRGLINSSTVTNPPVSYSPTVYYGNIATLASATGLIGPSSVTTIAAQNGPAQPSTLSYSLGVQKEIPSSTAVDVAYVGSISRHLLDERDLNEIPMFAHFNSANLDPTNGKPLPDNFLRPYRGLSDIYIYQSAAPANYNALQISVHRRFSKGLQFGSSYTYSRALGIAAASGTVVSNYFDPRHRNYGPLTFDITHVLTLNYLYDLPNVTSRFNNKVAGAVLDHWTLSGITLFQCGTPFTPTFTTTNGEDVTGSTETAYINVIGNPSLPKSAKTFYHNFNTSAFALPAVGTFGNAGVGILRGPGMNNWDMALEKRFPIHGENRDFRIRAEFYNAFNHTQFTTLNTTASFNPTTGAQTNANFGVFTGANPARVIAFTARLEF